MENEPKWKEFIDNDITVYYLEEEECWKNKPSNHSISIEMIDFGSPERINFGTEEFKPYKMVKIPPIDMFKEIEKDKEDGR